MKKVILFLIVFIISSLEARELDLSASVISDNEKILSSRNMGYIKSIKVSEGDRVKKGALLYEIDSIEIEYDIKFTSEHREFLKVLHAIDKKEKTKYTENGETKHILEPFFTIGLQINKKS